MKYHTLLYIFCLCFCAENASGFGKKPLSPRNRVHPTYTNFTEFMATMYLRPAVSEVFTKLITDPRLRLTPENINSRNPRGQNIVHLWALYASTKHNVPALSTLLEKKADINMQDNGGNTPLHDLLESLDLHTVYIKRLIDAQADVHIKNNTQDKPSDLLLAFHRHHTQQAQDLLKYLTSVEKEQAQQKKDEEKSAGKKE